MYGKIRVNKRTQFRTGMENMQWMTPTKGRIVLHERFSNAPPWISSLKLLSRQTKSFYFLYSHFLWNRLPLHKQKINFFPGVVQGQKFHKPHFQDFIKMYYNFADIFLVKTTEANG
jgi:hypothetical protein